MAETGVVYSEMQTETVTMDSDLSAKTYYAVNRDATDDNNVNLASDASAFPYVLVEGYDGSTTERLGVIATGGVAKVKLGGTVAPGDKLTSDGNGKWVKTTTDTNHYGAVAEQIGVANDIIPVTIERGMIAG